MSPFLQVSEVRLTLGHSLERFYLTVLGGQTVIYEDCCQYGLTPQFSEFTGVLVCPGHVCRHLHGPFDEAILHSCVRISFVVAYRILAK